MSTTKSKAKAAKDATPVSADEEMELALKALEQSVPRKGGKNG